MIKTFNYRKTLAPLEEEVLDAVRRVLHSGRLILGPETEAFEEDFAAFVSAGHAIGVNSGTSALHVALVALGVGPGDEVITVSNTCVPTAAAITLAGATPVFVDVREDDLMMDPVLARAAITPRTRCILPVHLWGQCVDLDALVEVAEEHGLFLVEDCAQAHGTLYRGTHVGRRGNAGCFSFYPTKNLGAFGEAGAVVTDDNELASRLRSVRMYGYNADQQAVGPGMNARMSELQAAILRVKLRRLPQWIERRRAIAALYGEIIRREDVRLPCRQDGCEPSFHQYVIRCRDRDSVISRLRTGGIEFGIHYPRPVHTMPAYAGREAAPLPVTERASIEILSLPVHESLTDDEVRTVAETVNG